MGKEITGMTITLAEIETDETNFEPMNKDTLYSEEAGEAGGLYLLSVGQDLSQGQGQSSGSTCLTPVSQGMDLDLSMVANKGSMTLSMDGFDDEEEATLSAATTPSLPADSDGPKVELCYCCPTHAHEKAPPDVASDDPKFGFTLPVSIIQASPEHRHEAPRTVRRIHDPVSPRMQQQISLFEDNAAGAGTNAALHASINLPAAAGGQQLRQDARLRKFENLTQSTSNSNFPFESNTLKRAPLEANEDVSHTQSCVNLKSSSGALGSGSPQRHADRLREKEKESRKKQSVGRFPNALSACSSLETQPHPGALIVKERFIEPPKRGVVRGYHGKTQSMDADFLFNEFLLLPAMAPARLSIDRDDSSDANADMMEYDAAHENDNDDHPDDAN